MMLLLPLSLASSHTLGLMVSFHFQYPITTAAVCLPVPSAGEKFHYLVMNVVVTAVKKGLRSGQEVCD